MQTKNGKETLIFIQLFFNSEGTDVFMLLHFREGEKGEERRVGAFFPVLS